MANKYLPEDLVMDILHRLPVKFIVRFSCVCKSWYALSRESYFITQHLKHPSSSHKNGGSILFFEHFKPMASLLSNKSLEISEDISTPYFDQFVTTDDLRIYGPCDGIVCLYRPNTSSNHARDDKLALWNPATRDFRSLPLPHTPPRPEGIGISSADFGIGFDSRTKDYKVVCVTSYYNREVNQVEVDDQVEVYTISTNSWRKIDDTIVPATIWSEPKISTYVNGFYYWPAAAASDNDNNENVILSFDMSNEVFQKMLPPPDMCNGYQPAVLDALLEINGCFAAICRLTEEWSDPMTIWVMNEDGVGKKKEWIKHSKIDLNLRGLGLCKNGNILMEAPSYKGGELVSYSCDSGQVGYHGVHENPNRSQFIFYKESLVSLSRKEDNE